tara:strand:- start:354 stop:458 length:105 start_codon:yes stop_codon:yes gene_type:complete
MVLGTPLQLALVERLALKTMLGLLEEIQLYLGQV